MSLNMDIDKLLAEVKEVKENVPRIPKGKSTAETIALFVVKVKCLGCGYTYTYPSSKIMVKYGKNYTAVTDFTSFLSTLPRETHYKEAEADRCQNCW